MQTTDKQKFPLSVGETRDAATRAAFGHLRTIATNFLLLSVACAAPPICAASGPHAATKTPTATTKTAAEDEPAIDPAAMKALDDMGTYLRTLQAFQVQATSTTDSVTDDGQTIQFSRQIDVLAQRPNRLRVQITGDDIDRMYFYDGKNFTIFGRLAGYYATVAAPATISALIDQMSDKYDIELPLVDLFRWGADADNGREIKGAIDVGPTSIGGVTCEQYAFHEKDIDWQVWIQLGQYPLPRKLVIRTLDEPAKPQHSEILTWNLAPSFDQASFTFDPPSDAHKILVEDFEAQANEPKK